MLEKMQWGAKPVYIYKQMEQGTVGADSFKLFDSLAILATVTALAFVRCNSSPSRIFAQLHIHRVETLYLYTEWK